MRRVELQGDVRPVAEAESSPAPSSVPPDAPAAPSAEAVAPAEVSPAARAAVRVPPATSPLTLEAPTRAGARRYVDQFLDREAPFFTATRDARTGLVFDGVNLDRTTGAIASYRRFSAPSKECLDLAVLARIVQGDPLARRLASSAEAVRILERKIDTYERFDRSYPGYGGFMPWITISENGTVAPAGATWDNRLPALDNGEWLFGLLAVEHTLRRAGHTALADRYARRIAVLRRNVRTVFFDELLRQVRGSVHVSNNRDPNASYRTEGIITGGHGVHESAMMLNFMSLYADPPLDPMQNAAVWSMTHMNRVETPYGTTWQGYWGSSHEEWEYAMLPKTDHPGNRQLFRIRQAIRTQDARARGRNGFNASVSPPEGNGYRPDAGIQMIASERVTDYPFYAPYAVFPVLLAEADNGGLNGIQWLARATGAPSAMTQLGVAESISNDGRTAAPMKTVDGSFLIWLGLMGGTTDIMRSRMRADGVYDRYMRIQRGEYREAFWRPLRETSAITAPRPR
jgi:hypothetical protein